FSFPVTLYLALRDLLSFPTRRSSDLQILATGSSRDLSRHQASHLRDMLGSKFINGAGAKQSHRATNIGILNLDHPVYTGTGASHQAIELRAADQHEIGA